MTADRSIYGGSSRQAPTWNKPSFRCNMPHGTPHFQGRADILADILSYLTESCGERCKIWARTVAIVGLGGIGKSETACQFAMKNIHIFPNAVWINAETEESTLNSFLSLAKLLEIVTKTTQAADLDLVKEVYRHIDAHYQDKVLFIFDNAIRLRSNEKGFGILKYMPTVDLAHQRFPSIIITSQTPDWQKGVKTFHLGELSQEESIQFFRSSFQILSSDCDQEFRRLYCHLQGHPLAMNIAASKFEFNPGVELQKQLALYIEEFEKDDNEILTSNQTLSTLWQLLVNRLQAETHGAHAILLLQASSFFHNPLKTQDLRQVFTECHFCPGIPEWLQLPNLKKSIRLLQRYYAANCDFHHSQFRNRSTSGLYPSLTFDLSVHSLVKLGARVQMDCNEVLEDILRYLAFPTYFFHTDQLNVTTVEKALSRVRLTTRALTFIGLMACHGNQSARRIVQTRSPRLDPAATIWRLYHLDKDMRTLNEDAIEVLTLLVVLCTFESNLIDKRCLARMVLGMFNNRRVFSCVREDATPALGIYLESFNDIQDVADDLLSTGSSFVDKCSRPASCENRNRTTTSDLTGLLGKQIHLLKLPRSSKYDSSMHQPQSSQGSNFLETSKVTCPGTIDFYHTIEGDLDIDLSTCSFSEKWRERAGLKVDEVDIDGKHMIFNYGAPDSSTTGLACSDEMHVEGFMNVTGPSTMRMEDATSWLNLLGPKAGDRSRPCKVKSQPAKFNTDHRDLDEHIISRIEERMANMPSYFDSPLLDFFRPHLPKLYDSTGYGINQLISRLQEMGELHADTVEELKAMTTNMRRCEKVYTIIAQRKALRPLMWALRDTHNSHVIHLMESWL